MSNRFRTPRNSIATTSLIAITMVSLLRSHHAMSASGQRQTLPGHVVPQVGQSQEVGTTDPQESVSLAIVLPLSNSSRLDQLLKDLYTPGSSSYGQFLSPDQFAQQFSPSQTDYEQVVNFLQSQGLNITQRHSNRRILDAQGTAQAVENAFQIRLKKYQDSNGRVFRATDTDPSVPSELATKVNAIAGLDTAIVLEPHHLKQAVSSDSTSRQVGTGVGGALSPSDIRSVYNTGATGMNGAGQTLALFELDGYNASDISAYENYYRLPSVPLQNVLVDGYSGSAGNGAGEVTLDIELMAALAPGASRILVYEGPNSGSGILDTYNRIATDNLAKTVSTSWGASESQTGSYLLNSESSIFKQFAAQGQSFFAASGDSGAYDNGSSLSVDDPSSQPYVTGAGGTTLSVGSGMSYLSEAVWNGGSVSNGASGGGISSYWSIPSWQQGMVSSAAMGSNTMRNVPDVALDADPNTGYSIYFKGGWYIYGGTSCAAPLWAAYASQVNQGRLAKGMTYLGFANPTLYSLAHGSGGSSYFHDVTSGTNLYYPAVAGYDLATGWGSFDGTNLFAALTQSVAPSPSPSPSPTQTTVAAPTDLTAQGGKRKVSLAWTQSTTSGITGNRVYRSTSPSGPFTSVASLGATTSYVDSGLQRRVTYYYYVTSSVSGGAQSPASNMVSATTQ